MSLKLKLKMLSRKMKMLGNMHPDYKGLGMYSEMSPYILKGTLLYFIKFFLQEMSIIFIDTGKEKITWYNQPLYIYNKKAIVCIDDKYCVCLRDNVLINTNVLKADIKEMLLQYFKKFHILDDKVICGCSMSDDSNKCKNRRPKDQSVLLALLNYQMPDVSAEDQSKCAEVLRHKLGEHIHNYLLLYNKTPADIADEFNTYLDEKYEKIVYIMC